jgi:hypothetical protein
LPGLVPGERMDGKRWAGTVGGNGGSGGWNLGYRGCRNTAGWGLAGDGLKTAGPECDAALAGMGGAAGK